MDFKNLCQKIDVDGIRAKIAVMPALTMPPIKMPKSMSKLKSRKIFRTSRENISSGGGGSSGRTASQKRQQQQSGSLQQLPTPPPPAEFINRTPNRISTISSLMHQRQRSFEEEHDAYVTPSNTYRSAQRIDDDYPTSRHYNDSPQTRRRAISPIRAPMYNQHQPPDVLNGATSQQQRLSLTEKIQKGYKDLSEFRLKHIFAKKTVLRKDNIEVQQYVAHYDEDRKREQLEQQEKDHQIADNYRFRFKVSRQNTGHTNSISSQESPVQQKNEQSDDESGMEQNLPQRKPGIAATRFGNVRKTAPQKSSSEESNTAVQPAPTGGQKGYKERLRRLTDYISSSQEEPNNAEPTTDGANLKTKLKELTKRRTRNAKIETNTPQETFGATMKNNFKRMQKSLKRQHSSINMSTDDEQDGKEQQPTAVERFGARLRRFKSRDGLSDAETPGNESPKQKSPVHAVIANKIQNWKKSFKRKPDADEETTPEKPTLSSNKRSNTLIKKLRNIRASKQPPSSTEELDAADEEATTAAAAAGNSNLEQRFEQARQRTIKKVNEKFQQIKFLKKNANSKEEETAGDDNAPPNITRRNKSAALAARRDSVQAEELEIDEIEEKAATPTEHVRAAWTNKPINADSVDSDAAESTNDEYPRVLIHQDNTDVFESTLIIAVSSPLPGISPMGKQLSEIMAQEQTLRKNSSDKSLPWLANEQIIADFVETTNTSTTNEQTQRAHARKLSVDSHSSETDVWLPPTKERRRASIATDKDDELPWLVHSVFPQEKLYKSRSINIFEKADYGHDGRAAFDDFDDELKNAPIVRIRHNVRSAEDYSSSEDPDAADDDNSSRITKILKENQNQMAKTSDTTKAAAAELHNSRESLIAHFDENEEVEEDSDDEADSDDRPPSAAPSPPPNMSPPPPPLPQRRISPLPAAAMPISLPKIPDRNESLVRIAKPLVKTASLRLAYSEQVKPADVGKVNKLISRFDPKPRGGASNKPMQRPHIVPRVPIRRDESQDYSEEDDEDNEYDYTTDEDKFNKIIDNDTVKARAEREKTLTPTNTKGVATETAKANANNNKRIAPVAPTNIKIIEKPNIVVPTLVIPDAVKAADNNANTALSLAYSKVERKSSAVSLSRLTTMDRNANRSRPSSEYGSPLEYPSSLRGSMENIPVQERRLQPRSRRSLARDEEHFHSFDSDEENSYYSISSTNSNRHVVEI